MQVATLTDTPNVKRQKLVDQYKRLLNETLPATYTQPVRFNHCFSRIVLDWLFQDCWYQHLDRKKQAYGQLTDSQLQSAISRMQEWLQNHSLLVADNLASLQYRGKLK
jgi:hypothetical protein